jgi:uncharacterized protein (DUF305 family)
VTRAGIARWAVAVLVLVVVAVAFVVGRGSTPAPHEAAGPGAVDIGFSQDMIAHHQQAILMATLAGTRAGPTVRAIAASILGSQSQELGALAGWLRLWGRPQVDAHPMAWMGMSGMGPTAAMPGMATPQQTSRLSTLQGRRFDVLFLQLMIRHHQGGVTMAAAARQHAGLSVVRQAAAAMIVEQADDIATMRALLRADGGHQLPAPH